MIIRQAREEDFGDIRVFVAQAFATAAMRNGDEQDFVDRMRASADFLPELALVAEDVGAITGFILLTRTAIADGQARYAALLLAPLAVAQAYRNQGLGTRLVREAFARARDLGHALVLLVGDPGYYRRFGLFPPPTAASGTTMRTLPRSGCWCAPSRPPPWPGCAARWKVFRREAAQADFFRCAWGQNP